MICLEQEIKNMTFKKRDFARNLQGTIVPIDLNVDLDLEAE